MQSILYCLLVFLAIPVSSVSSVAVCAAPAPCICVRPPACYIWSMYYGEFNVVYGGCDLTTLTCGKQALNALPPFHTTDEHYDVIDLSSNNISRLEEYAFSKISTSLRLQLFLDNNPISYMHELAFVGLENSSLELYLRNTRLKVLPEALNELKGMTKLTINGNLTLASSVMIPLGMFLPSLDIDMHGRMEWPDEMKYLRHLDSLDIKSLTSFPEHAFGGLESLRSLDMTNATLSHSLDAICTLPRLEGIYMHHVNVSSSELIPACRHPLSTVTTLFFFFVDMPQFPNIATTFPNVVNLYIQYAKLDHIDDHAVSNKNDITTLDLPANKLNRIPYAIKKMKKLIYVNLESNEITSIEAYDIDSMLNLTHVDLSDNPINFVSEFAFMKSPSINLLNLAGTHLVTIPRAILHLPNIQHLFLGGSPIECSCALQWLSGWDRLNVVDINGNCHQSTESISDFVKSKLHLCEISPIG